MMRFYEVLLGFYPSEYKALFAEEIAVVLREAAENSRRRGIIAFILFGFRETLGLIFGLGAEWMAKFTTFNSYMSYCSRSMASDAASDEVIASEKRIQFFCRKMEHAIAHHDFEGARFYAGEEGKERVRLEQLLRYSTR